MTYNPAEYFTSFQKQLSRGFPKDFHEFVVVACEHQITSSYARTKTKTRYVLNTKLGTIFNNKVGFLPPPNQEKPGLDQENFLYYNFKRKVKTVTF